MFKYLIYEGYKLIGGSDTFQGAKTIAAGEFDRIFDTESGKFCTCKKSEMDCPVHGVSAQLDRSQME